MLNKRRIRSLDFLEIILIQFFIILVGGIFYFMSNYLKMNIFLYNAIVLLLLFVTILVVVVGVFQFVKMKYIEAVKAEVKIDMDNYKTKIGDKMLEVNNRIGYFEVEYSKKLKKVTKDYLIKAKEIEKIKKQLDEKMVEIDKKTAELEIETCLMKIEKLNGEDRITFCKRIIKLNDTYPGICDEEILKEIYLSIKK